MEVPDIQNIQSVPNTNIGHQIVHDKVCFISYNSRGFSESQQQVLSMITSSNIVGDKLPIVCNQENFILKGNTYKILQTLPKFHVIINSAVKDDLNTGRPKGGMFIAIPDSIKNLVKDVSPGHWRLQAVTITSSSSKTLLINSYFPTDNRTENTQEAFEILDIIKNIIETHPCDSVVWAGDLNADFSRNSAHVQLVKDTMQELNISSAWDKFEADFTCYGEVGGVTRTSTIDHISYSEGLAAALSDAGVLHLVENRSDHCPIYAVFDSITVQKDAVKNVDKVAKPSWKRASDIQKSEYSNKLEQKLCQLNIPASITECRDVNCKIEQHMEEADKLMEEVLYTVQEVAEGCLPCPKGGKEKVKAMPGWNESVKPLREVAYFWHQVWQSAGRPLNTGLHQMMKKTRNIFHMAAKKCRRAEEKISKNKLLQACISGEGNIFKEIKAMRKTKQVVANSIDGVTDNISEHFKNIYSELFNSVEDADNMAKVSEAVANKVESKDIEDIEKVTPEILKKAAARLKPGKSDSVFTFSSDCIKVNSERLAVLLAAVFQSFLIHGHVTRFLLLATLVPIIKDKLGSISTSKNYRSIAISSVILKLIDWIIIILFGSTFGLNDLQFAYQPGVSGNMCSWAIMETVDYFLRNGSEVFACTMDMSKAFDVTTHSKMFMKMITGNDTGKGLSITFIRLLIDIYTKQFANVRWGNAEVSSFFPMKNGVRQGAVLSAIAYCFYMENMFKILKKKRSGCWINGIYLGLFGYSDDNYALAPTISALNDMMETISDYAIEHNLRFSTDPNPRKCKTKVMAFLKKPRPLPQVFLGKVALPWVNQCTHLGNTIRNVSDGFQEDMKIKRARYISKNVEINQEFYFAAGETRVKVNRIWNTHFSGSPLWNLFSPGAERIVSSYNRSIKCMLKLPLATHRYLLEPLSSEKPAMAILADRFLSFMDNIEKSDKLVIKMLRKEAMRDVRTTTGANYRGIMLLTDESSIKKVNRESMKKMKFYNVEEDNLWKVQIAADLLNVRDGITEVDGFEKEEMSALLNHICVS